MHGFTGCIVGATSPSIVAPSGKISNILLSPDEFCNSFVPFGNVHNRLYHSVNSAIVLYHSIKFNMFTASFVVIELHLIARGLAKVKNRHYFII